MVGGTGIRRSTATCPIIGAMKVLNLQCAHQHDFEGWFGSEEDYASQLERGLLSCPMCGSTSVQKTPSAPRLNLRTTRAQGGDATAVEHTTVEQESGRVAPAMPLQGRLLQALRQVMVNTEDVGERFADEARAMHHGEIDPRNIRGQTSPEVALELIEEGIDVLPLPVLPGLKDTLQ